MLAKQASFFYQLGCKDSNLGMAGPKPAALPLGDTPLMSSLERFVKDLLIAFVELCKPFLSRSY